ncbi:MAG: GNAT family N-acetyltransferase, partial [Desulforhopalus sp.]
YLQGLGSKQRHEVRRKMRRVNEAGMLRQCIARTVPETAQVMDAFIQLFRRSREDKKEFMTAARELFFRTLAFELSQSGMLNLFITTMDGELAAAIFCVELGKTTYLYNNGFIPRFRDISLGLVSKIATIRSSIEGGQAVYDFLGGTERYKYQLGGTEIPLMKCTIEREPS